MLRAKNNSRKIGATPSGLMKEVPRKHRVIGRILFQYSTVSVVSVLEKDKQTLLDQYSFRIVFLYKLV